MAGIHGQSRKVAVMTRWFRGIDFAGLEDNTGRCDLEVTGTMLTPHFGDDRREVEMTGIDCPFGSSLGFTRLLMGQDPGYASHDGYKTRHTERWLREHLWAYRTNEHWRDNVANNPQQYVNQTAHVQPTLGLQIVPGFLDWFRTQVGNGAFQNAITASRRGENAYVEAHPRPFLYSAVERIWTNLGPNLRPITDNALRAVVHYRDQRNPTESRALQRRETYQLLQQHARHWLGHGFALADPPVKLIDSDHAFDAWLSALTAFTHQEGMTIQWQVAGVSEEQVNAEGHILILSQPIN